MDIFGVIPEHSAALANTLPVAGSRHFGLRPAVPKDTELEPNTPLLASAASLLRATICQAFQERLQPAVRKKFTLSVLSIPSTAPRSYLAAFDTFPILRPLLHAVPIDARRAIKISSRALRQCSVARYSRPPSTIVMTPKSKRQRKKLVRRIWPLIPVTLDFVSGKATFAKLWIVRGPHIALNKKS